MSIIIKLGENNEKLIPLLDEYEADLAEAKLHLGIKGKTIEKALIENPTWQHYYDQKRIELYTLKKHFENEIARVRGKLFRRFKENHSRELNEREIAKYTDSEKEFLTMSALFHEVQEVYMQYESVVEAFRSRGFALNNITKIRVVSMEEAEL